MQSKQSIKTQVKSYQPKSPIKSRASVPKMEMQSQINNANNKTKQQNFEKHMKITITPQHYTSINVKYLGNHSLWKKTTFTNRYNDERLKYLNPDYFLNKYVLNVGCNQGFLDIQIGMRFLPKQIYGIDIDHKMIKNARRTLYSIVSKDKNYQQIMNSINPQKDNTSYLQPQKQLLSNQIQDLPLFFQDRLKNSFSLEHYLPNQVKIIYQSAVKQENRFPLNVKFQADNIYTLKYQEDKLQYDTILCLKITKWIHLTFGDEGVRKLFQKIYDLLKQLFHYMYRLDGILILQAQDWNSYKRKKNMHQIYKKNYESIRLGPNDFEKTLTNDPLKQFKFQLIQKIEPNQKNQKGGKGEQKKVDYPILVLRKMSTMLYY